MSSITKYKDASQRNNKINKTERKKIKKTQVDSCEKKLNTNLTTRSGQKNANYIPRKMKKMRLTNLLFIFLKSKMIVLLLPTLR